MNDLLTTMINAYGGLERWNQLESVSARLVQGGALWAVKGQGGVLDDVYVSASLHQERESHYPFGAVNRRSVFTPELVEIRTSENRILEALTRPRESFVGHTFETPWTTLQLAYFVGYAMWNYLTQPFSFSLPGFDLAELSSWDGPQEWRRLHITWPRYLATHSKEQTVYVDKNGFIRRHDYDVEILGGNGGAHFLSNYVGVDGIMVPTSHRIYPRDPDNHVDEGSLLISIDVSEVAFSPAENRC